VFDTQVDRSHCCPWGLDGGGEAHGNKVALQFGGKWKDDFENGKVLTARLKEGDAFLLRAGGGGGFGDPFQRPPSRVAEDVRQGYVTVVAARDCYGVAVDPETFMIDAAETARLRRR
jgi:N-methylhydantoinase B